VSISRRCACLHPLVSYPAPRLRSLTQEHFWADLSRCHLVVAGALRAWFLPCLLLPQPQPARSHVIHLALCLGAVLRRVQPPAGEACCLHPPCMVNISPSDHRWILVPSPLIETCRDSYETVALRPYRTISTTRAWRDTGEAVTLWLRAGRRVPREPDAARQHLALQLHEGAPPLRAAGGGPRPGALPLPQHAPHGAGLCRGAH
jgi:hypothetical protein